jgi:hypothetical protein
MDYCRVYLLQELEKPGQCVNKGREDAKLSVFYSYCKKKPFGDNKKPSSFVEENETIIVGLMDDPNTLEEQKKREKDIQKTCDGFLIILRVLLSIVITQIKSARGDSIECENSRIRNLV